MVLYEPGLYTVTAVLEKMKKAQKLSDFETAVNALCLEQKLREDPWDSGAAGSL